MTRSPESRFDVFAFNEAEDCVHISSMKRLRRFDDSATKMKKKITKRKKKPSTTPSPSCKYRILECFAFGSKAQEKEICNEPIDVDSEDGLDFRTPEKENSNEAIDLDAEVSCDTRSLQKGFVKEAIDLEAEDSCGTRTPLDKIRDEPIDVDTEVTQGMKISESDLSNGLSDVEACCQVGTALEDCAAGDHASPDHLASGCPIAGGNSFPRRSLNFEATSPSSEPNVPIATISDDDDDDERAEMNSSTYASSLKQNEVLLRGVLEHGFGGNGHILELESGMLQKFYPKGERDAVSISQREIELLQPERFINDNIIDFYINYLKNNIEPDKRQRFHFFNCFFFRKLADLDKEPFSACNGRAAFERVRTWTKEVNLFEKDYIFIPVNFKFHWSLVVVCHPGEVVRLKDEEVQISPKVPCILHMNSIKGSHQGLKNLFQSYLCELWKEKNDVTAEDVSSKFLDLKFIQLELPQQENWYDCGLFLLHYVELFLKEAPVNFIPDTKSNVSNFLSKNWFPPAEASQKRAHIRELISGIVENGSQEGSPADCGNKYSSLRLPDTIEQETGIEIVEEICNSTKRCHVSTPRSLKCTREPRLFYSSLFDVEAFPESFSDKCATAVCQKNMMPSIEELDEEEMVCGSYINQHQKLSGLEDIEDNKLQAEEAQKRESPTSSEELAVYVEDSEEESNDNAKEANDVEDSIDSAFGEEMLFLSTRKRPFNCKHGSL